MKVFITFIQTLLISLIVASCASRAPSKNMLDKKSRYVEMETPKLIGLDQELTRSEAKDVEIYVYPKELPSGDYFEGGYIRAIVEGERWKFRKHRKKQIKKKKSSKTKRS